MKSRKWVFAYGWHFASKYRELDRFVHEKIPLSATTEDEAIEEAKAVWAKKQEEAIALWEKQKASCAHPPKTAFDNGPWNPRVICEIEL